MLHMLHWFFVRKGIYLQSKPIQELIDMISLQQSFVTMMFEARSEMLVAPQFSAGGWRTMCDMPWEAIMLASCSSIITKENKKKKNIPFPCKIRKVKNLYQ